MDARTKLLDALAEVERLDKACRGRAISRSFERSQHERSLALHSLLPTIAALKEVVKMHERWDRNPKLCRSCREEFWPCPTLRALTRQFEEE